MSDYKPKSAPPTFPRFRKVPCLVDEKGGLIAGHGRVLAAKQLGLDEVPVVVARGWSEAQKRAYAIADNKLTENGGWDDALLAAEMADLKGLDFDITLTGFALDDIEDAPDSKYKGSSASSSSARTRRTGKEPRFGARHARQHFPRPHRIERGDTRMEKNGYLQALPAFTSDRQAPGRSRCSGLSCSRRPCLPRGGRPRSPPPRPACRVLPYGRRRRRLRLP